MRAVVLLALVAVAYACDTGFTSQPDPACSTSGATCQANTDCRHGYECCFGPVRADGTCEVVCWHPQEGTHVPGNPGNHHPGNPGK